MGREIRKVPAKWEHPKRNRYNKENNDFEPLMDDYVGSLKYYKDSVDNFINYMTEIVQKGKVKVYDKVWEDPKQLYTYLTEDDQMSPPDINDYMPSGEWYQLYENVSEGTPLTPAFEKPEELVEWLVNNKDYWDHQWTREQAEAMVKAGYAPSMVVSNGKIYKAEESLTIKD
jgi:hypothetical protein